MSLLGLIVLSIASYTDIKHGTIPDKLTIPAIIIASFIAILKKDYMLFALAALILLSFLLTFFFTDGIGGGDIKLFVFLTFIFAFRTPYLIVLSFILAAVYGAIKRQKEIRLAPFILAAYIILL